MTAARPVSPARPRALVTGASAGIGQTFAEHLAKDGYDLVLVARRRDRLEVLAKRLREEHRADVEVVVADLIDAEDLRTVEERAAAAPGLDLLVNNAGFGTAGPFAEADADAEAREIRLNVLALTRLTRAALPPMIQRGRGAIVNVSSMAGFGPAPYNATYAATKAFVNSFSEAIAEEVRGRGVVVQALCPGFTRTEFQSVAGVDVSGIPDFAWMEPAAVVEASLSALRSRDVICVPGLANQVASWAARGLPRGLIARATGMVMGRRMRSGKS
ncbi:MAG: SDR family NAD(P)-dependent oxidoreductase [Myxococcota bacterium]